jgi:hypothetical protein
MADREAGIGRRGGKARSACEKKPISLRFRDARRSYNRRNSPTAREYRAAGADEGRGDCAAATDGGGGWRGVSEAESAEAAAAAASSASSRSRMAA